MVFFGRLTQLVECLPYKEVVGGSSPPSSTMATQQRNRDGKTSRTWRARVRLGSSRDGAKEVYLGSFPTKREAEEAEELYRQAGNGDDFAQFATEFIKRL